MLRAARLLTRQRPRKAQSRSQHLLVLLRHGQSEWNADRRRFTGWVDVDLTEQGREEATHAGIMLKRHGFEFDEAHTSLLKRAVRTSGARYTAATSTGFPSGRRWRLSSRSMKDHGGLSRACRSREVKRPDGRGTAPKISERLRQSRSACGRTTPSGRGGIGAISFGAQLLPTGESLRMCQNGSCRTGSTTSCRRCGETRPRRGAQ